MEVLSKDTSLTITVWPLDRLRPHIRNYPIAFIAAEAPVFLLSKTCQACGKDNDDAAAFCIFCGSSLVPSGAAYLSPQAAVAPDATVLEFGMSHGEHKLILGQVDFVDGTGSPAYKATRESALHENYTIFKGDTILLLMKHKMKLGGYSFELEDGSGNSVGELHCKIRKGHLADYWYTDQGGDTKAALNWEQGWLKFTLSDLSHSQVYAECTAQLPGGLAADLKAMTHMRYTLSVPSGSALPMSIVLAFCVTAAHMP